MLWQIIRNSGWSRSLGKNLLGRGQPYAGVYQRYGEIVGHKDSRILAFYDQRQGRSTPGTGGLVRGVSYSVGVSICVPSDHTGRQNQRGRRSHHP